MASRCYGELGFILDSVPNIPISPASSWYVYDTLTSIQYPSPGDACIRMNSGESGPNALEFEFVKKSLSVSGTSKWSHERTFDRVADLRRILGEFGRGRRMVRVVELGEDAKDVYGRSTTRPCYFARTDIERRSSLVVAVVVGTNRRKRRDGEGVGQVDGARGDNPSWFCVLGGTLTSIIRRISLLGRRGARCARPIVLFRVFERIGRRRRPQPRHGDLEQTQDDDDGDNDAWNSLNDGETPSISGPSFDSLTRLRLNSTTTTSALAGKRSYQPSTRLLSLSTSYKSSEPHNLQRFARFSRNLRANPTSTAARQLFQLFSQLTAAQHTHS